MADPKNPKFFQATIEMELSGRKVEAKGMVSEHGVTRMYINEPLPMDAQAEQPINIKIDFLSCRGVLTKQIIEHGIFFEIKFISLTDAQKDYLRQRMEADGIHPGWQRKFPRIPVTNMGDPNLPVPNLCLIRFVGQEVFVNVVNFTLGGIRIETIGDSLAELRVGSRVQFDLMITTGDLLHNLQAEVRNISVNEQGPSNARSISRSFGLKLQNLDPVTERRYRELIRDYCLNLQKKLNET